ncbi:MAG: serine/threonine protein kinase [Alphaproteobacteria bacterium]
MSEEAPKRGSGETLPLGSRSEVFPANPLPGFDSASAMAHLARMKGAHTADLMALICRQGYPPRTDIFNQLRMIDNPALLRLVDNGSISWPDGNRYFGFVFEQPQNSRLWQSIDEVHAPMTEDFIKSHFITPVVGALRELADAGIMHGSVRPTNIFWRETGSGMPQLGECVTAPPGVGQPVLFEPPDRAQAAPFARGAGTIADDMYAFGVTLVLLILGQNPMRGMDDAAIVKAKLEKGSFGALVVNQRVQPAHFELLRGLLHEDPKQRWLPHDLEAWIGGQRLTPKQAESNRRPARALMFDGKELWQIRHVIRAMADNVPAAVQIIDREELDRWLRRALMDDDRADRVQEAINVLRNSGRTAHLDEQKVAMVCMALDPGGPIFYRGQAFLPFGIGPALAETLRAGGNVQIIAEVISNQFIGYWVNQQQEGKTELVPLAQTFERVRGYIERASVGSGIERAAYELNPTLPCMSPLLRGQYILTPKDLLPALEKSSREAGKPREPIDRHLAAWIATRDRSMDYLLRPLNEQADSPRRALAIITLFSEWQRKHGPDHLPGLAGWLISLAEPLTRRYHYKPLHAEVASRLGEATEQGRLADLLHLLDDPKAVERDQQNFSAARQLYRAMTTQTHILDQQMRNHAEVARRYGRPVATYIAWVLSAMASVFSIMKMMTAG